MTDAPRLPVEEENGPGIWRKLLPWPDRDSHKYARGHLGVFGGGLSSSGAARLSARAGARAGAGAVTLLSPPAALLVNAVHLDAIMVRAVEGTAEFLAWQEKARCRAYVLGPGFGDLTRARDAALAILGLESRPSLVLDADGITAFKDCADRLFAAARAGDCRLVLTPHEGEFGRLFPDIDLHATGRPEAARHAAGRSGSVVVLKGAETVIAHPDGRLAVNRNGSPFLATAGSGDVLAGFCGGLLAQNMPAFEAACAAVWMHAEAAGRFGPGLTADDLPDAILPVLRALAPGHLAPRVSLASGGAP